MTTPKGSSTTVTDGIRVDAVAQYVPSQSDPRRNLHLYVYRITISNEGEERATLRARHWIIVDARGNREDVQGPGVVGEYPDLGPGDSFQYTSRCPLATEWGTMEGSYTMERPDGTRFEARIERFFLAPSLPKVLPVE